MKLRGTMCMGRGWRGCAQHTPQGHCTLRMPPGMGFLRLPLGCLLLEHFLHKALGLALL